MTLDELAGEKDRVIAKAREVRAAQRALAADAMRFTHPGAWQDREEAEARLRALEAELDEMLGLTVALKQ